MKTVIFMVLTDLQAQKLEEVWAAFLAKNKTIFDNALNKDYQDDLIYMCEYQEFYEGTTEGVNVLREKSKGL